MTSNENQATKILIKNLIETASDYTNETAFYLSIKEAQNHEQKQKIKNIAKKFNIEV